MRIQRLNELLNYELQSYLDDVDDYQPLLHIFMKNRKRDYFDELGKYIVEIFEDDLPYELNLIKTGMTKRRFIMIALYFFTDMALDPLTLKKLFGKPIYHDEFGGGFYRKDDIDFLFASYFVEIDDVKMHLGYDHSGTLIEVKETDPDKTLEALKELVLMTKIVLE